MPDGDAVDNAGALRAMLYDPEHPKKSPLLGRFLSATVCAVGHNVREMELEEWEEPWLACSACGARFLPVSAMADDYEVVSP